MHPGLGDTRLLHWITCAVFKVRREGAPGLGLRPGRSLKTQQHAGTMSSRRIHRGGSRIAGACAPFQFRSTFRKLLEHGAAVCDDGTDSRSNPGAIPRKEVIQPHLPVRLPCYDFTPVTSPTFDGSLPCGLGHRLRVLLTPVV